MHPLSLKKKKSGRRRVVLMLAVVALLTVLAGGLHSSIPTAHASGTPTVVQAATADTTNGTNPFSVSLPSSVTAGDELVVLVGIAGGNTYQPTGFSDSLSSTWSYGTAANDGLNDWAQFEYAKAPSSGSDTVTITLTEMGCPCGSQFFQATATVIEIAGQNQGAGYSGLATLTENGTGGTTHTTNSGTGLSASNSDLDLALYVDPASNTTVSVPSGETQVGTNDTPTVSISHDQASAATQSSFTFDTSGNAGYAVIVAASFASA